MGENMSGYAGLVSRIKKCQAKISYLNRTPVVSVVYMDENGEQILEEGIEYHERGILLIPLPMTVDEWERRNIMDEAMRPRSAQIPQSGICPKSLQLFND